VGKLILPNQDVYVGAFRNGAYDGEGQYVWKTGDIYKGGWKQGLKQGLGMIQVEASGEVYEGEWV
jgi:hypothetical protein